MSDDQNTSDSSSSENEPAPAGEENSASSGEAEPPPAGDDTEPAPAGESSGAEKDQPLEDVEGHSDSSAETDSGSSSSGSSGKRASSSSSSSSSDSSPADSSSGGQSLPPPTEDEVAQALAKALQDHNVPVQDDGVKVTLSSGLYQLMVRLSADVQPLPQVPADTSNLPAGSVQGAMYLLLGSVVLVGDQVRVNMRIVSVETSEIVQASSASGSGSPLEAIQGAAGDCLAGLPGLNAR
jgi:hypothetical protein